MNRDIERVSLILPEYNKWNSDSTSTIVMSACALEQDMKLLPAGDHTEVGEQGIALSGGQRARVTLARAVYSQAQTVLLDDVLAALDVHTGKWIVEHCLQDELMRGRTVLLVVSASVSTLNTRITRITDASHRTGLTRSAGYRRSHCRWEGCERGVDRGGAANERSTEAGVRSEREDSRTRRRDASEGGDERPRRGRHHRAWQARAGGRGGEWWCFMAFV
jgi:ATPase subunit of ABC transporter with duplicated ATPase domains